MRKLNFLLCAGALVACASGKSAERPDEEWTETTDPMATQSVEAEGDPAPARVSSNDPPTTDQRAQAPGERAEAAQERAEERAEERADVQRAAPVAPAPGAPAPADNTDINERDTDDRTLTPMDQGGSEGDREITQQIRQAVVGDDSLSFTAKNVKIITIDGKVTLRGPVKSQQERSAIGAAAKKVAGARVDNQLEIAK